MIIQTSANQFYCVTDTGSADLSHVWNGVEVKLVKNQWVPKAKARVELVRKVATTIIDMEAQS